MFTFCYFSFTVVRVKILGKIKKDEETEASSGVLGDVFTLPPTTGVRSDAPQISTVESLTGDPATSSRRFQKPSDSPPKSNDSDAGSLLGLILGRHRRSIGIRGVPPPGGDLHYRPIGGKGRDKGMMYYDVLIKKIFKGEDRVRRTKRTFVNAANPSRLFARIYFSSNHGQELEPGVAYMLSGKIMDNELVLPSRGCWMEKWHDLSREQVHGLNRVYAKNCDCMIRFCVRGPHCERMKSFKHPWCDWELGLENLKEPTRDCGAKHNMCLKRHGECQWTTGKGYDSCVNPSGLFP